MSESTVEEIVTLKTIHPTYRNQQKTQVVAFSIQAGRIPTAIKSRFPAILTVTF